MTTVLALAGPIPKLGVIVAVLLAAIALVTHVPRLRAAAMGAALVLTPILLVADIWNSPQLNVVRNHPLPAAVAALVGLGALVALALLMLRQPLLLPLLAIAALPFRIPIAVSGSTSNLLVPLYLVVAAGTLATIIATLREEPPPASPWVPALLERLLALFIVLYAIQTTYSSDFDKALQQIVFFYVPFALLFVLLAQTAWTPKLLRASLLLLVGLALLFCLIGYVEYATRHLFINPKLLASNDLHAYFRTNSVFFDPNIYGRFLVIVMLTVAAVMLHVRRDRIVGAGALVLVALWAGLVLTLSQSSLVALLVGLATLAALQWGGRRILAPIAVVVLVAGAIVLIAPGTVGIDLHNLNNSSSGRVGLVQGGGELFTSAPVFGHGSGSFEAEYRARHRREAADGTSASHTIPITIAAEQGVVGLIAYLALLLAALVVLLRGARERAARSAVAAAFAALVVHTFFYAAFLEDPLTWTLLGVGVALAATPQPPAAERARARLAARETSGLPAA
jgi:putative inorganic carbon (HCO3(-)) transporter